MTNPVETPHQIVHFSVEETTKFDEFSRIYGDIKATAAEQGGRVQLLGEFVNFGDYAAFERAFANIRKGLAELKEVERFAVLTDRKWMDMIVKSESFLLPHLKMKAFDAVNQGDAKNWLLGKPV